MKQVIKLALVVLASTLPAAARADDNAGTGKPMSAELIGSGKSLETAAATFAAAAKAQAPGSALSLEAATYYDSVEHLSEELQLGPQDIADDFATVTKAFTALSAAVTAAGGSACSEVAADWRALSAAADDFATTWGGTPGAGLGSCGCSLSAFEGATICALTSAKGDLISFTYGRQCDAIRCNTLHQGEEASCQQLP